MNIAKDISFNISFKLGELSSLLILAGTIAKTGTEDTTMTFSQADFTSNFYTSDNSPLTKVKFPSLPANGTLKLSGVDITANQEIVLASLANITFVPAANYNGAISFSWNGSNGTTYAASSSNVTLTITNVNDSPVISNYSISLDDVTPFTATVTATDVDLDTITYSKGTDPTHGSVVVNSNGSYTYTPTGGYYGTDTFTIIANDGHGGTATSTVTSTASKSPVSLFAENVVTDGGTITATLVRSEWIALPALAKSNGSFFLIGNGCKVNVIYAMSPAGALIPLAFARSGVTTRINASGAVESIASGMPSYEYDATALTPRGWSSMPARTNLFLNSQAPATQTITVVTASVYTISVRAGSGSVTLSGAATGTVAAGSSLTVTTSGTSLVVTVTGSPGHVQVELGAYKSPEIWTSGSTVTRPAETSSTAIGSWYNQSEAIIVCHSYFGRTADSGANNLWQFDDGTANYRNYVSFASSTVRFRGISVFNAVGTTLTTPTGTSLIASSFQGLIKGGVSWNSTLGKLSVAANNGAAYAEVSGVIFPTAATTFRLGHTSTGALTYGGQIRALYIIPAQSDGATIQSLVA